MQVCADKPNDTKDRIEWRGEKGVQALKFEGLLQLLQALTLNYHAKSRPI